MVYRFVNGLVAIAVFLLVAGCGDSPEAGLMVPDLPARVGVKGRCSVNVMGEEVLGSANIDAAMVQEAVIASLKKGACFGAVVPAPEQADYQLVVSIRGWRMPDSNWDEPSLNTRWVLLRLSDDAVLWDCALEMAPGDTDGHIVNRVCKVTIKEAIEKLSASGALQASR